MRHRQPREWLRDLFADHADVVFRYSASRCGPDAAHDITAETFTEALRTARNFNPRRGSARAWLLGIATHQISRYQRVEARHLRRPPAPPHHEDTGVAERVDADRMAPALREAVGALPDGEREAFLLHVIADLDHAEVASALDISGGAARTRVSRARARLQTTLACEEVSR